MLLIYHCESKILEDDIVFEQGMSPDNNIYTTVFKSLMNVPAFTSRTVAGKNGTSDVRRCKILAYIGKMLPCKHFRRSHDTSLEPVSDGKQTAEYRYHGLAGTDIPLKKTVHLASAHQIGAYFLYHPLLRSCERIWKRIVAGMEIRPHP